MPFIAAPNIVQAEMRYQLSGEKIENRINVNVLHTPTVADMTSIANALSNALLTLWKPLLPATFVATEVFCRSMEVQNGPQASFPITPAQGTGTNIGSQLPNNCSLCVSLRSNLAGRSARGRLYWPALMETVVVNNIVDTAHVAAIASAVRGIDVNLTAVGFLWTIVSHFSNNVLRPGGPVYFEVSDVLVVDSVVDSMRRRLPGRGQ